MKKLIALILAVLLLTGCQLASVEMQESHIFPMEEIPESPVNLLVGAFVTMEPMGQGVIVKIPVTLSDDGWEVPGYEGLSMGRYWNGEYWTSFSGEGICELKSDSASGDEGERISMEGTISFPMESKVTTYANFVCQTPEGEFYVIGTASGNSNVEIGLNAFNSDIQVGTRRHGIQDEKTWIENGVPYTYTAFFTTVVRNVEVAEQVALIWIDEDYQELSRVEYAVEQLPESVTPAEGAALLIVEQDADGKIDSSVCQPGDEQFSVYYQSEHPWCLAKCVTIQWPE